MGRQTTITPELSAFITTLDMFYLSTAYAAGQPYIQYRGGPKGFLKVLDERTPAFADFRGNRQYISVGNLSENPKAVLFLMDYASQSRVKVWDSARVLEGDQVLLAKLWDKSYQGTPERAIPIAGSAWDANCRQHIHRRYDESSVREATEALRLRLKTLEAEVARLSATHGMD
jgi:predicted pyridoxine 5'-phosphate oxidase superfamily flavin-nucleotide-binding protein